MVIDWHEIREEDYATIKSILDYYRLNTAVTLASEELSIAELKQRIPLKHPVYKAFVIQADKQVCGFCHLSPYRNKPAYKRSAEVAIYLKPEFTGFGIGKEVLIRLESLARDNNIGVLLATITGGNASSETLFEKCAYQKCAHIKQVGEKFNRLYDVLVYQKILVG